MMVDANGLITMVHMVTTTLSMFIVKRTKSGGLYLTCPQAT